MFSYKYFSVSLCNNKKHSFKPIYCLFSHRILKLIAKPMATFTLQIKCFWSKESGFESIVDDDSITADDEMVQAADEDDENMDDDEEGVEQSD